jgi:hypothetical protein
VITVSKDSFGRAAHLLLLDSGRTRECVLVPTDRRHEVPTRPEVLAHEIPLPFAVHPRQMDSAFALDEPNDLPPTDETLLRDISGALRPTSCAVVWE